jgi:DNA-binding MarR family transcriptional regulator
LNTISKGFSEVSEMKKYSIESSSSITQKIQKLEKLKLLRREIDEIDKRKLKFYLTEKGKKTIKRIEKKIEIVSSVIFLKFSKKEKEIFMKILKEIENSLPKCAKAQERKKINS